VFFSLRSVFLILMTVYISDIVNIVKKRMDIFFGGVFAISDVEICLDDNEFEYLFHVGFLIALILFLIVFILFPILFSRRENRRVLVY